MSLDTLRIQIETLDSEIKEMQGRMMDAALSEALTDLSFADNTSKRDLFSLVRPRIVLAQDGSYRGPNDEPLEEFVREQYSLRPMLNGPPFNPGSPATLSFAEMPEATTSGVRRRAQLEEIQPGMSTETQHRVRAEILEALRVID